MATIKETKRDKPKHSVAALTKNLGGPKKGGAGRHGWGKLGDEAQGSKAALNSRDPNYESDEDDVDFAELVVEAQPREEVSQAFVDSYQKIRKFKQTLAECVDEFLRTSNREAFMNAIKNLNLAMYHFEIPRVCVLSSLSKSEEDQKKTSTLLQYLFQQAFVNVHQYEEAFRNLFNRLSDISLDVPNAEALLKGFLSRAVSGQYLSEAAAKSIAESADKLKNADEVRKAKSEVRDILSEYFENQDLGEAEQRIIELKAPHFHHIVVKEAVSISVDRSNRERELASYLIANCAGTALQLAEIEKGFDLLLLRVEDLYNDVPKALEYLSCFIARAVVDECLPPAFVARRELPDEDMGAQVLKQANVLLHKKHPYLRLSKIWGPGDGRAVPALKLVVRELITEYFTSSDAKEAKRCIVELNSPYFYHEVVMRLIVLAIDGTDKEVQQSIALIKSLLSEGIVSAKQAELGFGRVSSDLADLTLDRPQARAIFQQIVSAVGIKVPANPVVPHVAPNPAASPEF